MGSIVANKGTRPISPIYQRILVVGTSGSGKSTLAKTISNILSLPHTELDSIYHGPNWQSLEKEIFQQKIHALVTGERRWMIDGNYSSVRHIILKEADTLVWLDYPLSLVLRRVALRTFRRLLTRELLWNGNRESPSETESWLSSLADILTNRLQK